MTFCARLESALGRPQNLAVYEHPDIADLAASYAVGIAKADAFVDGNKRAAWATARAFLRLNGRSLAYDKADAVETLLRVAAGTIDGNELAAWFRDRLGSRGVMMMIMVMIHSARGRRKRAPLVTTPRWWVVVAAPVQNGQIA